MQLSKLLRTKTKDIWEQRAEKVLSHFSFNYPDEIDIREICRKFGVKIKPLDIDYFDDKDLCELIDLNTKAFSVPKTKGRQGTIYIDPDLEAVEKKILLAEEFCHCYAHHISQITDDRIIIGKTEAQAKRMSAYLLMPARFLEDIYFIATEEPVMISDIADYFTVTDEFAHYRLQLIYKHRVDGFSNVKGNVGSIEWLE
ncbi:ImmA/IrrE family metallo-endopeptidase [Metabacillus fastidiosus]|uniref:ImmA/IrrE family metallo-endopeptidase n=1 Tax=Metabacillus fastidiosus TaxID=1458 RepID=UPI003D2D5BE1